MVKKQHPKYINGNRTSFCLKEPGGKGWINQGIEIPIKDGKVQYLVDGKIAEEFVLDEFEEFAVRDAQPVPEKTATRDSLTGKWIVVTSNKGLNLFLWLIELTGDDAQGATAKLVSSSKVLQAAILKSAEISKNDVHLVFEGDGASLDFRGRFEDGFVRGNVAMGRTV